MNIHKRTGQVGRREVTRKFHHIFEKKKFKSFGEGVGMEKGGGKRKAHDTFRCMVLFMTGKPKTFHEWERKYES